MKVVGFVTEYNPFHLGHKYHLEQSKMSNSTHTIAGYEWFICSKRRAFINRQMDKGQNRS